MSLKEAIHNNNAQLNYDNPIVGKMKKNLEVEPKSKKSGNKNHDTKKKEIAKKSVTKNIDTMNCVCNVNKSASDTKNASVASNESEFKECEENQILNTEEY